MSVEFIFRLVGMVVFGVLLGYWGAKLGILASGPPDMYAIVLGMVGALIGLVLTPYITTRPIRTLRARLRQTEPQSLFAGLVGLIAGLIIAALLSFPLSLLPDPLGRIFPFLGVLLFGYLGVAVFIMRQHDIAMMFRSFLPGRMGGKHPAKEATERSILVDTSVLIDGRITDIARTGFLTGTMLIPRFVLHELQHIADSSENTRRQRGRRGMEVLAEMQSDPHIPVTISDVDVEEAREVDDKLVMLARQLHCPIMTNDYNLNRIAELQGISVLNINELANSVKTIMLPGEKLEVLILQEGKEPGQGVGYLDDGTMVVVENGLNFLQQKIPVVVTKVLQTAAGRMIFARPENSK